MVAAGYTAPLDEPIYAGGRDLLSALKIGVWMMKQGGYISTHDALLGEKLSYVIAGGDGSAPSKLSATEFFNLERAAFVELAQNPKTQERIMHMLKTGKPLRN